MAQIAWSLRPCSFVNKGVFDSEPSCWDTLMLRVIRQAQKQENKQINAYKTAKHGKYVLHK